MNEHFVDPLDYYSKHGSYTDPCQFAYHFRDIPTDIPGLCKIIQGFLLHVFWAERYGLTLTESQKAGASIRRVQHMLAAWEKIDLDSLNTARVPEKRLIGNCRNFSLLLCALLRHQGIPARTRCGFGKYFLPGSYEDHWVCEYWKHREHRWILVDAQLDGIQQKALNISFNPLDVPRDQFLVASQAWLMCREKHTNPESFGIFDMRGLWFVRGNVVRDIAALNKVPLLPWDGWGLIDGTDEQISSVDLDFLDQVARVCSGEIDYPTVRELYSNDARLKVPSIINSYVDGKVQKIDLEK